MQIVLLHNMSRAIFSTTVLSLVLAFLPTNSVVDRDASIKEQLESIKEEILDFNEANPNQAHEQMMSFESKYGFAPISFQDRINGCDLDFEQEFNNCVVEQMNETIVFQGCNVSVTYEAVYCEDIGIQIRNFDWSVADASCTLPVLQAASDVNAFEWAVDDHALYRNWVTSTLLFEVENSVNNRYKTHYDTGEYWLFIHTMISHNAYVMCNGTYQLAGKHCCSRLRFTYNKDGEQGIGDPMIGKSQVIVPVDNRPCSNTMWSVTGNCQNLDIVYDPATFELKNN